MGETYVIVTVKNPADRSRAWEGRFLVDTGAHETFVPRCHLEAIGIEPLGSSLYELADGSTSEFDTAQALLEFMGESVHGNVVFGDEGVEPLLGYLPSRRPA
ncbi:MAG: hypothetical protein OXD37_01480 [Acidimicrobiaceae bacterium]|nr:hypothetical protein [Acidimicrobiaceae bacterium]